MNDSLPERDLYDTFVKAVADQVPIEDSRIQCRLWSFSAMCIDGHFTVGEMLDPRHIWVTAERNGHGPIEFPHPVDRIGILTKEHLSGVALGIVQEALYRFGVETRPKVY